jgi:quercetin dioxygenase-like cupin family protein
MSRSATTKPYVKTSPYSSFVSDYISKIRSEGEEEEGVSSEKGGNAKPAQKEEGEISPERSDDVAFDLDALTLSNVAFRRVLRTTPNQQLVVMALDELGLPDETHADSDQFLKVVEGEIKVYLDGNRSRCYHLVAGESISVSSGTMHEVKTVPFDGAIPSYAKIYSIYSPPVHDAGLLQERNPSSAAAVEGVGGGFGKTMSEFKHGTLHSGSKTGPIVHSRKQAIAIAYAQSGENKGHEGHKKR